MVTTNSNIAGYDQRHHFLLHSFIHAHKTLFHRNENVFFHFIKQIMSDCVHCRHVNKFEIENVLVDDGGTNAGASVHHLSYA